MIQDKTIVAIAAATGLLTLLASASAVSAQTLSISAISGTRPAVEEAVKNFEAANPGVTVEASFTDDAAYLSVLPQQLAGGNAADVFTVWPGTYSPASAGILGRRGYVLDLTGEPWAAGIPETFSKFVGADGKVFMPPIVSLPITAIYNETALEANGMKPPTTWSEVLAYCEAVKAKGLIPYAFGAQTASQNQMLPFVLAPTLIDRVNPDFLLKRAAGEAKFADSEWVSVFEHVKQLSDAGCFKDPLGTDLPAAQAQLVSGEALGIFGHSLVYRQLESLAGDNAKIVATFMPATDNPDDTRMAVALGSSFAINANSPNADLAKKFLAFVMEPANAAKYAIATGQPPALPNDNYTPTPGTLVSLQYGAEGKTFPVPDQLFPNPNIRNAWVVTTQDMLGGRAQPIDVTTAMDEAWDSN
ncbi:MAG TPA: extracellular solute-binding protein [Devosia sp.]|nr:extracellular solute-binding protein [Devosia sp.]